MYKYLPSSRFRSPLDFAKFMSMYSSGVTWSWSSFFPDWVSIRVSIGVSIGVSIVRRGGGGGGGGGGG